TWEDYGGVGNPANASKQQQIAVANRVLAGQGPAAWPKCATAGACRPSQW
ncbi:transglycosylase family protein, partial [Mycobacterium szulgai]